jgi:4-amino-4-deoxy-L-arabinose transferase-like glycosyltransferase
MRTSPAARNAAGGRALAARRLAVSPGTWVLGLTLVSWVLHLYQIDWRCLWWDESLSLHRAQHDLAYILRGTIMVGNIATTDQHPPLFFALLRSFILLFGERDLILRLPAAAWATMIVPLTFALTKRLADTRTALIASALAALSPLYAWYGQEARMYTMVTALGQLALYGFLRTLAPRKSGHPHSAGWLLLSVLAAVSALATQYLFALSLAAALPLILLVRHSARPHATAPHHHDKASAWLWIGATLLLAASLLLVGDQVRRLLPSLGNLRSHVPLLLMLRDALNSFSLGLSVNLRQVWPLDVGFALLWLLGLGQAYRQPLRLGGHAPSPWRARFLSVWVVVGLPIVPILLLWAFSFFVPIYTNSRYLIAGSFAYYIGVALGIAWLMNRQRLVGLVALAAVLAAMGFSLHRYYADPYYRVKEDYAGAVALIARDERPRDAIVVNGPENLTAFQHYYHGAATVVALPDPAAPDAAEGVLASLLADHDRVWLLKARVAVSDPQERVASWLESHAMRVLNKGFPSCGSYVSVIAYITPPQPQTYMGEPSAAQFGDRLALLSSAIEFRDAGGAIVHAAGVGIPSAGSTPASISVPAGSMLAAQLAWLPLSPLDDYKVSMRLVTPLATWAQRDREPFMYLPTSQWPVGAITSQVADLPVPEDLPAGEYTLRMIVYRQSDGEPLAVRLQDGSAVNHLDLATLYVQRQADGSPPTVARATVAARAPFAPRWGPLQLDSFAVAPAELTAGTPLDIQLGWRLRSAERARCHVLVTFQDASGAVWHTAEFEPTGTSFGTEAWPADQPVRGIIRLPLPPHAPPGQHTVHLLVYDLAARRYLWLRHGALPPLGRDLLLGTITITAP